MPNVLILGATGYIGQAAAHSLTSSGNHTVYGLARTPEKAKFLASIEVIPVIGSISDSAAYLSLIHSAPIDIVLDVAGAFSDSKYVLEDLKRAGRDRLDRAKAAGVRSPKLGYIYGSGIWVHGSSAARVTDLSPVGVPHAPAQPPAIVAWRPKLEQEVLAASDVLDTMVVRPALVYGRSGTIWNSFFGPILHAVQSGAQSASIAADAASRPALIHVDDVASGYRAAVERLSLIAGTSVYPIFDLVTSQESLKEILGAAAEEMGFKGRLELVGPGEDAFMRAMNTSVNARSERAVQLLGWVPKRVGFVQGMEAFMKAWEAGQTPA